MEGDNVVLQIPQWLASPHSLSHEETSCWQHHYEISWAFLQHDSVPCYVLNEHSLPDYGSVQSLLRSE